MPAAIRFPEFLERHAHDGESLARLYPLGCLLDAANPTRASQESACVVPLLRTDGRSARVVIGRDPAACDVVLAGESVSRRHACVDLQAGRILLFDLGSATGTHLGERRLEPTQATPLPQDGITEVWFGDESFLHFGPRALAEYLRHILGTSPAAPDLGATPAGSPSSSAVLRMADQGTARVTRLQTETKKLERARPEDPAEVAARDEAWCRGLAAVAQLGALARAIDVQLTLHADAARPVRVYDVERDPCGLPAALRALDGLKGGVRRIEVTLRRSGLPVTVFDRDRAGGFGAEPGDVRAEAGAVRLAA